MPIRFDASRLPAIHHRHERGDMPMYAHFRIFVRLPVLCILAVSIAGCEGRSSEETGKTVGAVGGAAGGYVLGAKYGQLGQSIGTVGGALLGGYIGQQFGAYLDEGSRQEMNKAAQATLKTGKVQTWASPDGKTTGNTRLVANPAGIPKGCDTVRMKAVLDNGDEKEEDVTLCPDGKEYRIADQTAGESPSITDTIGDYADTAKEKAGEMLDAVTGAF